MVACSSSVTWVNSFTSRNLCMLSLLSVRYSSAYPASMACAWPVTSPCASTMHLVVRVLVAPSCSARIWRRSTSPRRYRSVASPLVDGHAVEELRQAEQSEAVHHSGTDYLEHCDSPHLGRGHAWRRPSTKHVRATSLCAGSDRCCQRTPEEYRQWRSRGLIQDLDRRLTRYVWILSRPVIAMVVVSPVLDSRPSDHRSVTLPSSPAISALGRPALTQRMQQLPVSASDILKAHSQMVSIRQPVASRLLAARSSRSRFAASLVSQKLVRVDGRRNSGQPSWRCQKHPCMKIAAFHLGRTMSGRPGRPRTSSRNRRPACQRALRIWSSGLVSRLRMRDMSAERFSGDITSAISQYFPFRGRSFGFNEQQYRCY